MMNHEAYVSVPHTHLMFFLNSVQEYLGGALVQVGLCKGPNPITSIRMNARFAFLEMKSPEDATSALNLDGIPFSGAALSVGRPKKVGGVAIVIDAWMRILGCILAGSGVRRNS